jgi:hypothetical protein
VSQLLMRRPRAVPDEEATHTAFTCSAIYAIADAADPGTTTSLHLDIFGILQTWDFCENWDLAERIGRIVFDRLRSLVAFTPTSPAAVTSTGHQRLLPELARQHRRRLRQPLLRVWNYTICTSLSRSRRQCSSLPPVPPPELNTEQSRRHLNDVITSGFTFSRRPCGDRYIVFTT